MKIDIDYIAKILDIFLETDKAHINLGDIRDAGITVFSSKAFDEKFFFHFQLMVENKLIGGQELEQFYTLKSLGITLNISGNGIYVAVPLRLTQAGHDFAKALSNKDVLKKIKSQCQEGTMSFLIDFAKKSLNRILTKKLDGLLLDD